MRGVSHTVKSQHGGMCAGLVAEGLRLVLGLGLSLDVAMETEPRAKMCLGLRLDLSLGQGRVGDWSGSLGDVGDVGVSTVLREGRRVWDGMLRSGFDKQSIRRILATFSLQGERGGEEGGGLDVGEDGGVEGREEQRRGLEETKSCLTILSLIRLNRDFTGEGLGGGVCASGSVLRSFDPGRQHSRPAVRPGL